MPQTSPTISTINDGCFIEVHIDRTQCCKKDNRAPSGLLPHYLQDQHGSKERRIRDEINCVPTQSLNHLIDESIAPKELLPDANDNHPAQKVREIEHALHKTLEAFAKQRIEH